MRHVRYFPDALGAAERQASTLPAAHTPCGSFASCKAVLKRQARQFDPPPASSLVADAVQMRSNGCDGDNGDKQCLGDLAVGAALREKNQNLLLSVRKGPIYR